MLRTCVTLGLLGMALAACKPPPAPPVAVPPPVKAEAPPPPPAPDTATAERKAEIARQVQQKGVLAILGASGGNGAAVSDVLKGGSVSDALSGAGGVGIAAGGGSPGGGGTSGIGAPRPSAETEWPALQGIPVPTTRRFLGAPPAALKTLGEVARHIDGVLGQHGYEEVGYFRYADGFAIATRPERISGDAKPTLDRRWPQARVHKDMASLQALFEVNGVEGDRYRSFLFLCMASASDVDFQGGAEQSWGLWKTGSMNPEGDTLLARPVGAHKLYAFIYELSQDKEGKVLIASTSLNTAMEHLRGAGLTAFLR